MSGRGVGSGDRGGRSSSCGPRQNGAGAAQDAEQREGAEVIGRPLHSGPEFDSTKGYPGEGPDIRDLLRRGAQPAAQDRSESDMEDGAIPEADE